MAVRRRGPGRLRVIHGGRYRPPTHRDWGKAREVLAPPKRRFPNRLASRAFTTAVLTGITVDWSELHTGLHHWANAHVLYCAMGLGAYLGLLFACWPKFDKDRLPSPFVQALTDGCRLLFAYYVWRSLHHHHHHRHHDGGGF